MLTALLATGLACGDSGPGPQVDAEQRLVASFDSILVDARFGHVTAALVLPNGDLVISDSSTPALARISPHGTLVATLLERSAGPRGLLRPTSLRALGDSELVALDVGNARVTFLSRQLVPSRHRPTSGVAATLLGDGSRLALQLRGRADSFAIRDVAADPADRDRGALISLGDDRCDGCPATLWRGEYILSVGSEALRLLVVTADGQTRVLLHELNGGVDELTQEAMDSASARHDQFMNNLIALGADAERVNASRERLRPGLLARNAVARSGLHSLGDSLLLVVLARTRGGEVPLWAIDSVGTVTRQWRLPRGYRVLAATPERVLTVSESVADGALHLVWFPLR